MHETLRRRAQVWVQLSARLMWVGPAIAQEAADPSPGGETDPAQEGRGAERPPAAGPGGEFLLDSASGEEDGKVTRELKLKDGRGEPRRSGERGEKLQLSPQVAPIEAEPPQYPLAPGGLGPLDGLGDEEDRRLGLDEGEIQAAQEILLEERQAALEDLEFVVTSTKHLQSITEAPSIISVITREQMQEHNCRNLAEALGLLPGIFVNSDYVFHDVGLRGISGELRGASHLIKVLINGQSVSFRSETTNFLGAELIPLDAIERVEVIRGPASALYGANAFLGVVNVITRYPGVQTHFNVSVGGEWFGDTQPGTSVSLTAGGTKGPFELFVAAAHLREDRSGLTIRCTTAIGGEKPCDDVTEITEKVLAKPSFDDLAQPSSFLVTLGTDLNELFAPRSKRDLGKIRLLGNLQILDSRGSFSDWGTLNFEEQRSAEGQLLGRVPNSGNRVALYNGVVRADYRLSFFARRLELQAGAAYAQGGSADTERLRDISGSVERSRYGFDGVDLSLGLDLTLLDRAPLAAPGLRRIFGGANLSFGLDHSQDHIFYVADAGAVPRVYTTSALSNLGLWGQLSGSLLRDKLTILAGLRFDRHRGAALSPASIAAMTDPASERLCGTRVCYDQPSFRLGATYRLLEDALFLERLGKPLIDSLFVKLLWGTAFMAPSPVFLYNDDFLGERPLNPNPALLPQRVVSTELLLGARLLQRRLELSVALYQNFLSNKAEFMRYGLGIRAENGPSVSTLGAEVEGKLRFPLLTAYGNLSAQASERLLGDNLDRRIGDTFGYPDWMGRVGLSAPIKPLSLLATLELAYVGKRVGHYFNRSDREDEKYTLAPYALLHLDVVTTRWMLWEDRETKLSFGVHNLLDRRYDYPGYQPYYRYDVPGQPRLWLLRLQQEL